MANTRIFDVDQNLIWSWFCYFNLFVFELCKMLEVIKDCIKDATHCHQSYKEPEPIASLGSVGTTLCIFDVLEIVYDLQ